MELWASTVRVTGAGANMDAITAATATAPQIRCDFFIDTSPSE